MVRHRADYQKDYFTNVITQQSIEYFTTHALKVSDKPLFMVVSHAAPHGPEDGALKYSKYFPNATAPR